MLSFQPSPRRYEVLTLSPRRLAREESQLRFAPLTTDDIPLIAPYLKYATARTCDFTVGGLLMWADYFSYSYAIARGTLFIKGVTEDDVTRPAFSLPVGRLPLSESIPMLREYCNAQQLPMVFSAVPEAYVETMKSLGAREVMPLEDWADYLYDAQALATLTGKKLSKKRNHVNRFMADHPDYTFEPLTPALLGRVKAFYREFHMPLSKPALADVEREAVMKVLDHVELYPFEGAVLSTPADGIVAFTLGEVIGDTLYTHIEKMNHEVAGAGETVNKFFAEMMLSRHRDLRYINREEDVGDPGLRHAKESYHPARLLTKYNVEFRAD